MGIKIKRLLPGRKYVVTEDYYEPEARVLIPKGFTCDHASILRILWAIICPQDLSDEAPVTHDYLYAHAGTTTPYYLQENHSSGAKVFSKAEADKIFDRIMRRENVQPWKRRAAYFCVKYFAGFAWNRHKKKNLARLAQIASLCIIMLLGACSTVQPTAHAQKITDIEATGVFEPEADDTPKLTYVKQKARETAEAGKTGIAESEMKREKAESKAEKAEKLANVGRYTIGGLIAIGIFIIISVFLFVFKIIRKRA